MSKVIGYIRVSTEEQDVEKNKTDVSNFAQAKGFSEVEFITEKVSGAKSWKKRKLNDVAQGLKEDDVLIVPELSRLGRSLMQILDILNFLTDKKVKVYSVKENFQLNGDDIQSKVMRNMLGTFAEIERDLIIQRTKEGMQAAKKKGRKFGSPQNLTQEGMEKAWKCHVERANQNQANRHAFHFIKPRREKGLTFQQIADELNAEGYTTRRGKAFHAMQVRNIYLRFKQNEE
jgi:DNA invertase Pin-like site-specific DNA recombinase